METNAQGARIEAIMNRTAEDVSVDFLSRVLVDVQLDSSKVVVCFQDMSTV